MGTVTMAFMGQSETCAYSSRNSPIGHFIFSRETPFAGQGHAG